MTDIKYSEFEDRKVTLTTADEGERQGTVNKVNAMVVMFTPKGTSFPELVEVDDVVSIEAIAEKPRKLNQKAMDPVPAGRVRRHLLDYHGSSLEVINGLTDLDAEAEHERIDHADLGHHHEGRKKSGDESEGEADSDE